MPGDETTAAEDELAVVRAIAGPSGDVVRNDSGWTSRVYLVDRGRVVVKFPLRPEVLEEYAKERRALADLAGLGGEVALPSARATPYDAGLLALSGIVGAELGDAVAQLPARQRTSLGGPLGRFLRALHACELPWAPRRGPEAELAEYREKYELAVPALVAGLDRDELARLRGWFERELPEELAALGWDDAVSHGDLGYWNLVLRPDGGLGVIDFGDVGHYDRSQDFLGLEHPDLLDAALAAYGGDAHLEAKVRARQPALPVLELPYFVGRRDDLGIRHCLERIRAHLRGGRRAGERVARRPDPAPGSGLRPA